MAASTNIICGGAGEAPPKRKRNRRPSKTIEDMRRLAASRGGTCLAEAYKGSRAHLLWRCAAGHEWSARPVNISSGYWCRQCSQSAALTMRDVEALVAQHPGGRCLSDSYKNSLTPMRWECAVGHQWTATHNSIQQGSWCPECSRAGGSLGERTCRAVLERMFGIPFPTRKPKWLIGTSGRRLELDGYAESQAIAFEYHGGQHYRTDSRTSAPMLAAQQARDEEKLHICRSRGLRLVVVHEFRNSSKLKSCIEQIEHAVLWAGIDIPRHWKRPENLPELYDPLERVVGSDRMSQIRRILKERGGFLLSSATARMADKLAWQCALDHRWEAPPASILSGKWCRQCGRTSASTKLRAGAIARGAGLSRLQEFAASRGGLCLSAEYLGRHAKHLFQCGCGNRWEARASNVLSGCWCPDCGRLAVWEKRRLNTPMDSAAAA